MKNKGKRKIPNFEGLKRIEHLFKVAEYSHENLPVVST